MRAKRIKNKIVSLLLSFSLITMLFSGICGVSAASVNISVATEKELYNALKNATTSDQTTITLTNDIQIGTNTLYFNGTTKKLVIKNGQNITLDLDNYILHANSTKYLKYVYLLEVEQGATLNLISDTNGELYKDSGGICIRNQGNLTINANIHCSTASGGTGENRIFYNEGGTLTINGGTFYGDYSPTTGYDWSAWGVHQSGTTVINDGTFYTKFLYDEQAAVVEKTMSIVGGKFYYAVNPKETFNQLVKSGYTYNKEGIFWVICKATDSLKDENGNQYNNMVDAIAGSPEGSEIILLTSSITVSTTETWTFGSRSLEPNGNTITLENGGSIVSDKKLNCIIPSDGQYAISESVSDGIYTYTIILAPNIATISGTYYIDVPTLKADGVLTKYNVQNILTTDTLPTDVPQISLLANISMELDEYESVAFLKGQYSPTISFVANKNCNLVTYSTSVYDVYFCHKIGDVNCDNNIDILDLICLKKILAGNFTSGFYSIAENQKLIADIDLSGSVAASDLTQMRKVLLGITA